MSTGARPGYVYVASSWRNTIQPALMHVLHAAGVPAYDFRNPPESAGFGWEESIPGWTAGGLVTADALIAALEHPRAVEGFNADFDAMRRADTFVLLLPCGRSAHLELGWAVGAGKRTAVLLDHPMDPVVTPELMYRMVDHVAPSVHDLLGWLGVSDK